jgi:putative colanic acid biosynthesis UDP-glucose lipid carrier transferase
MNKTLIQYLRVYFRVADAIALNLAFFVALIIRFGADWLTVFKVGNYPIFLLFFNVAWLLAAGIIGLYTPKVLNLKNYRSTIRIFAFLLLNFLMVTALNGALKTYYSRLLIFYLYGSAFVLMPFFRYVFKRILISYRKKNELNSFVLIIAGELKIKQLTNEILGLEEDELVTVNGIEKNESLSLEEILKLIEPYVLGNKLTELYLSLNILNPNEANELLKYCESNLIRLRLIPAFTESTLRSVELVNLGESQVLGFPLSPLDDPANKMVKRAFDLAFSLLFLVLIGSWLFPILAMLIKLGSKGPVFFVQKRSGINNVQFNCLKFRTMRQNAESDKLQATQNDPRITGVGRFLRRTSLDETPQFINVLKGEMSVVGPRPHMLKHTEEYAQVVGNFMQRHAIKPGITGLAQVKGYRGEIQNKFMLTNRIKFDTFYVENWSLAFDFRIIFLTVGSLFKKHL